MITGKRFDELKAGMLPKDAQEVKDFRELLAWEKRSKAAKRAVETKRAKYEVWPTRAKR